jgi:hypothetical protein
MKKDDATQSARHLSCRTQTLSAAGSIDLAWPGCQDKITGHEEYDAWNIDPKRWIS